MNDYFAAFKSHLDGDPVPRPDELEAWNELRKANGQDEFLCAIVTPNPDAGEPFPGMDLNWWEISEKDGTVICESAEVDIEIIPGNSSYFESAG